MDPYKYVSKQPYKLYINGEFTESASKGTFSVINPAKGDVFATACKGDIEDAVKAIAAAREAFDNGPWGKMAGKERAELLLKAGEILKKRAEEFACIETLDCGKVFAGVLGFEVGSSVDSFTYNAGKARILEGRYIPIAKDYLNYVTWEPHGVVGEILPWNGPLMMGCQKITAILAAGNTVIVKPSTMASLSMLKIAEVFHEAGFPPGVVNIITGPGAAVGNALVQSSDVDMVSMTGGVETGKALLHASSDTVKDLGLELGGKSPNIVFEDANMDLAVQWAASAFTLNSGQVCVSGTRLLLQDSIYDEFIGKLVKFLDANIIPGDGFDTENNVNFGSLISREHAETVRGYIAAGSREGARLVCGGPRYERGDLGETFVPPTVFADVTPEMTIFQEEIFGPVLSVTKFSTEDEAIKLANSVRYGLAGAVFTRNISKAHRVAARIKGGQIYINSYFSRGILESPGVGWKESGAGSPGIQKYMIQKTVFVDISSD